jgi:hypothetical protein
MLGNVKDVCSSDQPDNFTCPQGRVNYNSAIFWGAIGPARLYNIGQRYSGLLHMFWIGASLPIITYFIRKRFPKSRFIDAIHWPIFFAGTGNLPPATGINYTTAFAVSFIFNKVSSFDRTNHEVLTAGRSSKAVDRTGGPSTTTCCPLLSTPASLLPLF